MTLQSMYNAIHGATQKQIRNDGEQHCGDYDIEHIDSPKSNELIDDVHDNCDCEDLRNRLPSFPDEIFPSGVREDRPEVGRPSVTRILHTGANCENRRHYRLKQKAKM